MLHHSYRGPRSPLMDIYGNFNARDYNIYKNGHGMNIIYNIGKKHNTIYYIYIFQFHRFSKYYILPKTGSLPINNNDTKTYIFKELN